MRERTGLPSWNELDTAKSEKLRAEQERDEALDQLERVQNEYLFLGRNLVAFLRANGRQP